MSEVIEGTRRAFRRRTCLHPEASNESCTRSIRAHTIQKSGVLDSVAEGGHVYRFAARIPDLMEKGDFQVDKIGVNRASTFYGFCSHHDNELFKPVDDSPFARDPQQCFLLAYRNLCRELYLKQSNRKLFSLMHKMDRGRELDGQMEAQARLLYYKAAIFAAIRDMESHKDDYDQDLQNGDYSNLRSLVLEFDGSPTIVASFGKAPDYDFEGKEIQDFLDPERRLDFMSVNLLSQNQRTICVFSWRKGSDTSSRELVGSLLSRPDSLIPHLLVQFGFASAENLFMTPSWWDGLGWRAKREVRRLVRANTPTPAGYQPDAYTRGDLQIVDWKLVDIEKVGWN